MTPNEEFLNTLTWLHRLFKVISRDIFAVNYRDGKAYYVYVLLWLSFITCQALTVLDAEHYEISIRMICASLGSGSIQVVTNIGCHKYLLSQTSAVTNICCHKNWMKICHKRDLWRRMILDSIHLNAGFMDICDRQILIGFYDNCDNTFDCLLQECVTSLLIVTTDKNPFCDNRK